MPTSCWRFCQKPLSAYIMFSKPHALLECCASCSPARGRSTSGTANAPITLSVPTSRRRRATGMRRQRFLRKVSVVAMRRHMASRSSLLVSAGVQDQGKSTRLLRLKGQRLVSQPWSRRRVFLCSGEGSDQREVLYCLCDNPTHYFTAF